PVTMRWHVDRHAGHRHAEVCAMVEIEAAQVVLIGLAFPTVLTDHDAGHRLEYFARAHHRARIELAGCDGPLTGRLRNADQVLRRIFRISKVRERGLTG